MPESTTTVLQTAQEVFNNLPPDPNQIALMLQEQGLRGRRISSHSCPISRYARLQGLTDPGSCQDWTDAREGVVQHPPQVREFIRRFDRGDYPQLAEVPGA